MILKFFDQKAKSVVSINKDLSEELRKLIIKHLKNKKLLGDLKTVFEQQI